MGDSAGRLATYEDLLGLDDDVRAEILGGEIVVAPAPLPRHANSQGALRRFIGGPFHDDDGRGGPGGWWIFLEVDVKLAPHDVVRPDVSGWRRHRLPDPGGARPIEIAPDWICEVTSPSTAARDRVQKRALYAEHGISHYWILDPEARTLEVPELQDERWIELGAFDDSAFARIPPFEDVALELGRLFLPVSRDAPSTE